MAAVTIREEPVETQESPGEAAEIPAEGEAEGEAEPPREAEAEESSSAAAPQEPLPKRKPGRPQGSKSKEPGKPRKPRAKKVEFVNAAPLREEEVARPQSSSAAAPREPLPKRKPGRPQGSKSKEPGKPRKPRAKKVVVQEEAVVEARPPQEELPRATPGSLPIPEEAYDLRAAKMLRLLQIHGDQRKQQKRQMYSSWFR